VALGRFKECDVVAAIVAVAAQALFATGEIDEAMSAATQAIGLGKSTNDDLAVCRGLGVVSSAARAAGRVGEALAAAMQSVELTNRSFTPGVHRCPADLVLAFALMDADCFMEAEEALIDGRQLSADHGSAWNLAPYSFAMARLRFLTGEWDDSLAQVRGGFALANETGARGGALGAYIISALISLHRNDTRAAQASVLSASREIERCGPGADAWWLDLTRALLEEQKGDVARALDILVELWSASGAVGVGARPTVGPHLIRLAISAGRGSHARSVAADVGVAAATSDTASAHAGALWCRGLVDRDRSALAAATDIFRQAGRSLECATVAEVTTTLPGGEAQTDVGLLEMALGIYEKLGASADRARVQASLRAAGVLVRTSGRVSRARTGWGSVTAKESEIALLVTEGLTNPEIAKRLYVSPRTVETHVAHLFRKLGVRSRRELRAAMHPGPPSHPPPGTAG
jgi:DNA-binding CsgD family transcriptional regulator